jgi:hypothetical protein
MSDRDPGEVNSKIAGMLDKFLDDTDNEVTPAAAAPDAPKPAGEPSPLALSAASARN